MPLHLYPLTPADTLSWTRIRALAYVGPTNTLTHTTLPVSESSFYSLAHDRKKEIGKPGTWHFKVVDTDLTPSPDDPADNGGRTIAIAVWSAHNIESSASIVREEKEKEKEKEKEQYQSTNPNPLATPNETPFLPPELKIDILNSLLVPLRTAQRAIMGREPYFMLNSLTTHPEHQGRGAAKLLLDWGLEKADREELVTYLDSSARARSMYERRGFILVREVNWDRRPWGGEGVDWYGCMVRGGGG